MAKRLVVQTTLGSFARGEPANVVARIVGPHWTVKFHHREALWHMTRHTANPHRAELGDIRVDRVNKVVIIYDRTGYATLHPNMMRQVREEAFAKVDDALGDAINVVVHMEPGVQAGDIHQWARRHSGYIQMKSRRDAIRDNRRRARRRRRPRR